MTNNSNNNQSESHIKSSASVEVTIQQIKNRTLTRKNSTGKSNYPTLKSGKITIIRYVNGVKSITNKVYRRIQPSD